MNNRDSIEKSRYNIEALARGLEVLALFSAQCTSLSFSQIVESLDINKSTVYRILSTLQAMGYLEQESSSHRYHPGLKVLQLGFSAINGLEIRQIVHPYLERLSQQVGETVSLAVLNGFRTVYIDRIRDQNIVGVVLGIGSDLPSHCTSLGKVLLSGLTISEANRLLENNELPAFTPKTITSIDILKDELDKVRQNGYAIDDEELAIGLRAASAPIFDISRRVVAAVNITGSTHHISLERLKDEIVPALLATTGMISKALGYFKENIPPQ